MGSWEGGMLSVFIVATAAVLLVALLVSERKARGGAILAAKTPLSCLFILAAVVQPHGQGAHYPLLLGGLLFCLVGDVCLALPQARAFLSGLVSFLLGHVLYVSAFALSAEAGLQTLCGTAVILGISAGVYLWLRPHLGSMNIPVILYVLVISLMVSAAWGVWGNGRIGWEGRLLVLSGALSFYLSDIFVARDRFLRREFLNRLVGLPLYYTGQFLLAFSTAHLA
jgi:uncharacterized membrane protein YhhN